MKGKILIWTSVAIIIAAAALSVQNPDDPRFFYTKNQKPEIDLSFSTQVTLFLSNLSKGSSICPLTYPTGYLPAMTVKLPDSYPDLATNVPTSPYGYVFNARSAKGTQLDTNQLYYIVIDKVPPTLSIQPNNQFFKSASGTNITFRISANERVKLKSITINGEDFLDFNMSRYNILHSLTTASMSLSKELYTKDGIKYIFATADDLAENSASATAQFEINANSELDIFLASPKYGKSPTHDFSFIIGTDNPANCEFIFDRINISYGGMNKLTASADKTRHTGNLVISDQGEGHHLWVGCYDPFWKSSSYAKLDIGVDTSAPNFIRAEAVPDEVVEPPLAFGFLSTAFYITTDDETICRYDDAPDSFESMRFDFDVNRTFKKTHKAVINITSIERRSYSYNVACINKAELATPKRKINFLVDLDQNLKITQLTPKYLNHSRGIDFRVKTNKDSVCTYSERPDAGKNSTYSFTNDTGYIFLKELSLEGAGNYTIYVFCEAKRTTERKTEAIRFLVDLTPPSIPYVDDSSPLNDSQYHYSRTSLRVNFSSKDPDSGIKKFTYQLIEKDTLANVTSWRLNSDSSTWEKWNWIRGLNLSNLKTYVFVVRATNRADLTSLDGESDGVTIDVLKIPEYCSNKVLDAGSESDIDCGKICPACEANRTCSEDSDCLSDFCRSGVCTKATCTDGRRNQGEGDIDCGGPCEPCADGRRCNEHEDCLAISSCVDDVCKFEQNHCKNRVIDGGETDLNCGGTCTERCGSGKACLLNSDCLSDDCENGRCNSATCYDYKKNQKESDVDCGGGKCSACEAGKSCIRNSDCASENCVDFSCSKYSVDEWLERSARTKKMVWSFVIFLILGGLLSGGGYYAYRKGYLKEGIDLFNSIDWKTLKRKSTMPETRPAAQRPLTPDEMRRRQAFMAERAKKADDKKVSPRKGFDGVSQSRPGPATPTKVKEEQRRPGDVKETDDLFSKLDGISKGKSQSPEIFEERKDKKGLDTALSDLSKLTDDIKKKKEKK